jgi:hypothetical protein
MATLRYWDGTQYQPIPGPPAGAYTAVGPTAPNASTPGTSLVPPNGFLWVDTGTTIPPQPYVPPQAPPASGWNTFTDAAGTVWVSNNGSAWKLATAIKARLHRQAAWTMTQGANVLFDTMDVNYGFVYNASTGVLTVPVAGDYLLTANVTGTTAAAGDYMGFLIQAPAGGNAISAVMGSPLVGWEFGACVSAVRNCNAGDSLSVDVYVSNGKAGNVGNDRCYFEARWVAG